MRNVFRSSGAGGDAAAASVSTARRRGVLALLIVGAVLCAYLALIASGGSSPAYASPTAPPFLGEVVASELPLPGVSELNPQGVAVEEATGDVYLATGSRLMKLSPYGAFIREITAAAVRTPGTVAIEQSTGAIYVLNRSGDGSVVRLSSAGSLDWALGNDVNATKVQERKKQEANSETVTVTKEEEDICTAASGDECQQGQRGVSGGLFETNLTGDMIAVGGPAEHLYVGDSARVHVFNAAGTQVGEDSLSSLSATGTVRALAVDAAGDVFVADWGVEGVHEIEPGGSLSGNVYGSFTRYGMQSLAVDGSGDLYVGGEPTVTEFEVASPAAIPAAFGAAEPGRINAPRQIAVDGAGAAYVAYGRLHEGLLLFGSLSQMEAAYGPPAALVPTVETESSSPAAKTGEVTLEAQVNPQLRATTYQFQYGLEPCSSGGCTDLPPTPAAIASKTKTPHLVTATASGLQAGRVYYFRVLATNGVGSTTAPETSFALGEAPSSGPPGLPDGRRYELVSPANKHGNSVHPEFLGLATPDGNEMIYEATGGVGSASTSVPGEYIARRSPQGWSTAGAVPPQVGSVSLTGGPDEFIPSQSFSKFLFLSTNGTYTHLEPTGPSSSANVFQWDETSPEATWLGQPLIEDPNPALGHTVGGYYLAGASPELNHVYFTYDGTLVPEDAPRAANTGEERNQETSAWGFYEWNEGHLRSAGILPDGSENPYGAVAASFAGYSGFITHAFPYQVSAPEVRGNEVSTSGDAAFFVSPDPLASTVTHKSDCEQYGPCSGEAPQLYVRETEPDASKRTVLVSRSELPGSEGQPATDGAEAGIAMGGSYVFASPDGSVAFFRSKDRLTSAAPANDEPKVYKFDLATESLTYLPGVTGRILAVDSSGSDFIFVNTATHPNQIELWRAGTGGGEVRPVAQLPGASVGGEVSEAVTQARVTEDGSVFLFGTSAPIPTAFNNGGGYEQLYRYAVSNAELRCVSCPGTGQAPSGNAEAARGDWNGANEYDLADAHSTDLAREMSANGERVFFDSPNALTAQATNGQRDVYEWENGKIYLISSGSSSEPAYVMDSSASGNDVFFGTSAGLVAADTDGAYDVYDARIPHPGDTPAPEAAPCEGAVCQGPPSTPQLLTAPASESFSGPGNLTPPSAPTSAQKGKAGHRSQQLRKALKKCRHERNSHKRRRACMRRASALRRDGRPPATRRQARAQAEARQAGQEGSSAQREG